MSRRGFALITVLWVTAILSAVVGTSLGAARTGGETSRNRIVLTRGGWAREACLEILFSRHSRAASMRTMDTVDLGRGAWCRAELTDPAAKLDLNLASPDALRKVLGNDSLADALLDWRDPDDLERSLGAENAWYQTANRRIPRNGPLAAIEELRSIRGFDSLRVARLGTLLTVEGQRELNLNAAAPELLATLPGLSPEGVSLIMARRRAGQPIQGSDQLLALLSPQSRSALLQSYQEFTRVALYAPPRLVAVVEGGVRGATLLSRASITVVPVAGRLAVIRRRTE